VTAQFLRSQIPERHGRLRDGKLVVEAAHGLPPRTKMDRKTAEACGPTGSMDNGVQIDLMDLRRRLSTWRVLKNMMLLLLQTDRFLHLQATLLKSVRLHAH